MMRRIRFFQYFSILAVLAVMATACNKDCEEPCTDSTNPECPNYDPCYGRIPITAEFTISQQYSSIGENSDVFIQDDTVTGGTIKFTAIPQEGATYTWILGIDTFIDDYEITSHLGHELPAGVYSNKLIVTKPVDSLCFPNDPDTVEFERSFIKIVSCEASFLGRYRGVFAGISEDSVEIELALSPSAYEILPCDPGSIIGVVFAVNFNLNGDTIRLDLDGAVNTQISFDDLNNIETPEGEAIYNRNTHELRAIYTIGGVPYDFTGRKL